MEDQLRVVRHAGDVDRHKILADLLPLHCAGPARRHVEHLRPQPANTLVNYTVGATSWEEGSSNIAACTDQQWPAEAGWMVVSLSFCKR